MRRREFLATAGTSMLLSAPILRASTRRRIQAVAFDGFAIFDPSPVVAAAESIVPGHGRDLVTAWRTRLFEYQWLRTLGRRYVDFGHSADDALTFATKSLGLTIAADAHARLLDAQLRLTPWDDAARTLDLLRTAGLRLAFLSNMTEQMLKDGAKRAGFLDQFKFVLSTDRVQAAKPDPRAYAMALDAFALRREQIAFVAFAGWDAAGASWFGYPTLWTNRASLPAEELNATSVVTVRDLAGIVELVTKED